MRKIIVLSFVTLDGIIQAPGGPQEDVSGGFKYGGWMVPFADDFLGQVMGVQMGRPFDLLLGRKTYEIFASYWPLQKDPPAAALNKAVKFVASKTLKSLDWSPSVLIQGDSVTEIQKLKKSEGPDLQVHGSGNFIQTLWKHDLVDELWLKTFPLTLGRGKRLFAEGAIPASFELRECRLSPNGVCVANYERAGEVKTGSFVKTPAETGQARREPPQKVS